MANLTTLEYAELVSWGSCNVLVSGGACRVSSGLTGGSCGKAGDDGLGVGTRSWEVDRTTGSTGAAVAEPVDVGVGSDRAGGVSGMDIFGGMDGRCKWLMVAAGPRLPRFSSILCVDSEVAGLGVDMSLSAPTALTGGSCVCARGGSGTTGSGESEKGIGIRPDWCGPRGTGTNWYGLRKAGPVWDGPEFGSGWGRLGATW